jgi:hypothetical protein
MALRSRATLGPESALAPASASACFTSVILLASARASVATFAFQDRQGHEHHHARFHVSCSFEEMQDQPLWLWWQGNPRPEQDATMRNVAASRFDALRARPLY